MKDSLMCVIQCTIYSVQYTVYNIQYTIYSVQYTVYNIQLDMELGHKIYINIYTV